MVDESINQKTPSLDQVRITMGLRARERRAELGLTLQDVAARMTAAGRPQHKGNVSKLERGVSQSPPSMRDLIALAHALETHPALLLLDPDSADLLRAYLTGGLGSVLMVAAGRVE